MYYPSSRHQKNKISKVKTILQVSLLLGVIIWLVYQVKHSYDKRNEYFEDKDGQSTNEKEHYLGRKASLGYAQSGDKVDNQEDHTSIVSKEEEDGSAREESFDQHDEERVVLDKERVESRDNEGATNVEIVDFVQEQGNNVETDLETPTHHGSDSTDHRENSEDTLQMSEDDTTNSGAQNENTDKLDSEEFEHPKDENDDANATSNDNNSSGSGMEADEFTNNEEDSSDAKQSPELPESEVKETVVGGQDSADSKSDVTENGASIDEESNTSHDDQQANVAASQQVDNAATLPNEGSQKDASENKVQPILSENSEQPTVIVETTESQSRQPLDQDEQSTGNDQGVTEKKREVAENAAGDKAVEANVGNAAISNSEEVIASNTTDGAIPIQNQNEMSHDNSQGGGEGDAKLAEVEKDFDGQIGDAQSGNNPEQANPINTQ